MVDAWTFLYLHIQLSCPAPTEAEAVPFKAPDTSSLVP